MTARGAQAPARGARDGARGGAARGARETTPALFDALNFTTTTRARRPQCKKCHQHAPTIDGYCVSHMSQETEGALYCISPEQLGV